MPTSPTNSPRRFADHPAAALILALVVAIGAAGCDEPCAAELEPWADLNHDENNPASLEDGDVLEVVFGSQGGMHVEVGAWLSGLSPGATELWVGLRDGDLPSVRFELEAEDGILTVDDTRPTVLMREGDGSYAIEVRPVVFEYFAEFPEDWSTVDFDARRAELAEETLELRVVVEDSCGRVAMDACDVRVDFGVEM